MKRTLPLLALYLLGLSFASCGTMHGAGEDLEDAGEAVQEAAD